MLIETTIFNSLIIIQNIGMEQKTTPIDQEPCSCNKLPYVAHELSQSLFIINDCTMGFLARIDNQRIFRKY